MSKKAIKLVVFITFTMLLLYPSILFAYWGNVHVRITSEAVNNSSLIAESLEQIGFKDGVTHSIKRRLLGPKNIREWIEYGSKFEDRILCPNYFGGYYSRDSYEGIFRSHFYNPITNLGLTDDQGTPIGQSLIERSKDINNEWSYQMAKELYYAALTGDSTKYDNWAMRDRLFIFVDEPFQGKENMNADEREKFFAWTFQALGHTLHLIQDASVPSHTRNDAHSAEILGIIGEHDPFERWTRKNVTDDYYADYLDDVDSAPWIIWKNHTDKIVPDIFIDTDQLSGESENLDQGLSEYSHANFLSNDSMFSFDLPEKPTTQADVPTYDIYNEEDVIWETYENLFGDEVKFLYLKSKHTGGVDHLALCGILYHAERLGTPPTPEPYPQPYYKVKYTTDDPEVNKDYAEKLIPRAIGYSAGLLDYFFRGSLEVSTCVPLIYDNKIVSLNFTAKNVTASEETMSEGNFTVVVRYTPVDGNPDGSEDQFFRAQDVYCNELQYEDELEFTVDLPLPGSQDSISFDVYDSIKCYLVFKGTLGAEEGAVIGKVFTLGEIKFREDWNNGLDGNHDWAHGQSPTEPVEGGKTTNNITTANNQDTLIKENIRYTGVEDGRSNQSALSLGGGNEILITPNTFLHFKIDSISVSPPSTIYLQALRIQFANGTWLQFCPDGQCDYPIDINWPPMDIDIVIDSENSLVTVNIHRLFQEAGIVIPEYLYLRYINFIQLFEEGAGPATTQRMEIDFIRIVEETP